MLPAAWLWLCLWLRARALCAADIKISDSASLPASSMQAALKLVAVSCPPCLPSFSSACGRGCLWAQVVPGQMVLFKAPAGGFCYHSNTYRAIGMISGGTGRRVHTCPPLPHQPYP